ncbi:MAG: heparinase II/III family protein [Verrucomicrobiales bacterium]|nr:heparinase II/III family protein [Verrucomicrobiales bacterium]
MRRAVAWLACLLVVFGTSTALAAWEGVDWNAWNQVSSWTKPDRVTRQSGRTNLVPLLGSPESAITNALLWANERQVVAETIQEILGTPTGLRIPGVEVRDLGVVEQPDHSRRHILIRSEPEDWIPAYLLVPRGPGPPRRAAVICLHQTVAQGKEEPCGMRGDPEMAFALELVRRGYVCLAPDVIGFGERIRPGRQPYDDSIAFFRKHASWSFMGKMTWDVSRMVDYLQTLPEVDPERLGSIGHSHGAYGTLFATAFEPRLKAAVASCGFTTFRSDPHPERWSHLTALIPQLGRYLPEVRQIPFDWQHVLSLAAPRALYVWYTTGDAIFPNTTNLDALLRDVQGVYRLHNATERLAWRSSGGPHVFPRSEREAAYAWLDRMLAPATVTNSLKTASALYPQHVVQRAQDNARQYRWAAEIRDSLVAAARPWVERSDDILWDLMFGNTLKRAWQVWSDGHCPACRKPVPMYEWQPDALNHPWKMQCPRCRERFPKNDFGRFYRSGLDPRGVFNPALADRSLLYHAEHPDPADPLHRFGVDDGDGYVSDGKRWRFINAYLIFGQWKQGIVDGIRHLAGAYVATGDPIYAHKAGVLLDRVADLYPTFDFGREGVMYEGPPRAGYVSTWHDACVEIHDLALAYDAVFGGLAGDTHLVRFLRDKAARHGLANPKASFADIQRNIEERLLRDTLANRPKIESNYPMTDRTVLVIDTVLEWPRNRERVLKRLDGILENATAVDGVTGEKGIAGYSVIAPRDVAELLGRFLRSDPEFVREALRRHPRLHAMYRFHLDTWCLGLFYPRSGDTGSIGARNTQYAGVAFTSNPGIQPSSYVFLWELFQATGDADFVRALTQANGGRTAGLPYDLFASDPESFQAKVESTLGEVGNDWRLPSIDKPEWCLAILRSGHGSHARAVWLDYDSGERHGHADALTLGLFAHGEDLLPDFGYPPVQYGGWTSPRATWYTRTAAHNTVSIDGKDSRPGRGKRTLWWVGGPFQVVRASAEKLVGAKQFERTVALVDVSPEQFYVVDLFRVDGGSEHTRHVHGPFGTLTTAGLDPRPSGDAPYGEVMRNFRLDEHPASPWSVTWSVEDRLSQRPGAPPLRLRFTDLTRDAGVRLAEAWVSIHSFIGTEDSWIPSVLARRQATVAPLVSTFAGVYDSGTPGFALEGVRRLELVDEHGRPCGKDQVGMVVTLTEGGRDLLVALNPARDGNHDVPEAVGTEAGMEFRTDGEVAWVRLDREGKPTRAVLCLGTRWKVGGLEIRSRKPTALVEIDLTATDGPAIRGDAEAVESVVQDGRRLWPRP